MYYDPVTGEETTDSDMYYDPVTGQHVTNEIDNDCHSVNSSCNTDNNAKLSVDIKDLYSNDTNSQSITMAALFNYNDEKDVTNFGIINLPEIKLKYDVITKLFFNEVGKGFSSHFLNKIWKGITNLSLSDKVLAQYEKLTGNNRSDIPAVYKVKLYKECAIDKISSVANKSFGLNLHEFNTSLSSVDIREDSTISSIVPIHLYFNSIKVGVIITIKFSICDIPSHLICKHTLCDEEEAGYNFNSVPKCNAHTAEIVLEKPNSCCVNNNINNCEFNPSATENDLLNYEFDPSCSYDYDECCENECCENECCENECCENECCENECCENECCENEDNNC